MVLILEYAILVDEELIWHKQGHDRLDSQKNRIQEVAYGTLTEENLSKRHQLHSGRWLWHPRLTIAAPLEFGDGCTKPIWLCTIQSNTMTWFWSTNYGHIWQIWMSRHRTGWIASLLRWKKLRESQRNWKPRIRWHGSGQWIASATGQKKSFGLKWFTAEASVFQFSQFYNNIALPEQPVRKFLRAGCFLVCRAWY